MNALPWYKSPVYISLVTSIVSQLLAFAGRANLFPAEDINAFVTNVFQAIAIAAVLLGEWKRRNSEVQPIALTQKSAEAKDAKKESDAIAELTSTQDPNRPVS